jgi:hypothetical protein
MTGRAPHIVHIDDVEEIASFEGEHWGQGYKPLTPALDAERGRLGANLTRVPSGRSSCPYHAHQREHEIFCVLSGRGVFRHGDAIDEVRGLSTVGYLQGADYMAGEPERPRIFDLLDQPPPPSGRSTG